MPPDVVFRGALDLVTLRAFCLLRGIGACGTGCLASASARAAPAFAIPCLAHAQHV